MTVVRVTASNIVQIRDIQRSCSARKCSSVREPIAAQTWPPTAEKQNPRYSGAIRHVYQSTIPVAEIKHQTVHIRLFTKPTNSSQRAFGWRAKLMSLPLVIQTKIVSGLSVFLQEPECFRSPVDFGFRLSTRQQ